MKEKEKGKFNPFVSELEADEEILWLSSHPAMTLKQHFLRSLVGWVFVVGWATLSMAIRGPSETHSISTIGLIRIFAFLIVITLPIQLILYVVVERKKREKGSCVYMLTNRRVFSSTPEEGIITQPLEHTHEIYLSTSRTIMFEGSGTKSHIWKHIRNAKKVIALMNHAREARLDDLYLHKDQDDI
jgi:hypothetical protein